MSTSKTLYELIGDERLLAVLRSFYDKVFQNAIIGPLFQNSHKEEVLDKQYCFLSQFLGGTPRYNDKYGYPKMRQKHLVHNISKEQRDEWLRLMRASIDETDMSDDLKRAFYNCFPHVANQMTANPE